MWLKLDIDGIIFHFRICDYRKSTEEWYDEWSSENLTLQSKSWLNYQINGALLLTCEVEELHEKIESLLTDKMVSVETMECIEPDLTFVFQPKQDLRNVDIGMELSIAFWNGGLMTANRLTIAFDRSDLEKMLCYLELIIGKKSKDDEMVKKMIKDGCLYGEVGGQVT
ncbi:MAG: hypothetical protein Q4C01_03050 [Clostridia bacterium]|nr:hypothetical protein [Clostridia bacterium]